LTPAELKTTRPFQWRPLLSNTTLNGIKVR
jgi:hypothetical protein